MDEQVSGHDSRSTDELRLCARDQLVRLAIERPVFTRDTVEDHDRAVDELAARALRAEETERARVAERAGRQQAERDLDRWGLWHRRVTTAFDAASRGATSGDERERVSVRQFEWRELVEWIYSPPFEQSATVEASRLYSDEETVDTSDDRFERVEAAVMALAYFLAAARSLSVKDAASIVDMLVTE